MLNIATLTVNPTIDKSTAIDTVASEIKMRCVMPTFDPGGGGINVSRAVKKLGGESVAVYTSGGTMGELLGQLLAAEDLDTRPVPIGGLTRENLTVFEETTGLQYRFGMPGPEVSELEWKACLNALLDLDADYIVASGSLAPGMPEDFYFILAQRAKETNAKVIVDTSGVALEACYKAGVFMLKPNLRELEILSGEKFSTENRVQDIAQDLIRGGMAELLVISMGGGGAMMITADEVVKMRPPVVPVLSKVGAGDSMVGGLVWGLANGEDLRSAVRYGIAAGSAAVMTAGTDLCRREDVMDIYQRIAIVD